MYFLRLTLIRNESNIHVIFLKIDYFLLWVFYRTCTFLLYRKYGSLEIGRTLPLDIENIALSPGLGIMNFFTFCLKELGFCQNHGFYNPNIVSIQCRRPLIFLTMNSFRSHNDS